ncbi:TonB-dependent receptor [Rhabdobacter roseus]|uniref:Outer membrane receptor for ferrienterochelin and colicin n=1 Tax=Rhabdobacter roseus TaxID=1655419 RepID=A0A840TKD7_9BACT|nr:TonB-dependent receptor [Rhabdobacter roseus]MBB5282022.1 outer membrane receptor for ferrienterochelin and colicin [Rhabdobacter roseus]
MKAKALLLILFCCTGSLAWAQTGTIRGTVKDAKNNEPLIGATVRVAGTTVGVSTDIEGFFTLPKLAAGTYTIEVSFISYKTKAIPGVEVQAEKITEINTGIEEESTTLEEVRVVATRETNTEISMISEIKAAQQIVSGISAQQIGRTLDRDAAQVVRRVPGITIVGDRFINIRGLNQRYNNVMLHNAFTPSMETDVKAFSFDIIPSSQIDRLLVFKSPAAELPGEFAGGIVKIFTKNIPNENSIELDYNTTFRQGTTFGTISQPEQGANYWTGFNNGYQNLPKFFPASLKNVNGAQLEQAGRMLRNNWEATPQTALPDQRLSLTGNFRINAGKVKIGNITSLTYSDARLVANVQRKEFNTNVGGVEQVVYDYNDQRNARSIRVGLIHNWAVKFNDNHSIEWKNLYNQNSIGTYVDRTGQNFEGNFAPNIHSFDQIYRGIYTGQVTGKHQFGKNTTIDWVGGYNNSYREQPDYRRYRADIVDPATGRQELYVPVGSAVAFFLGRFSSRMDEHAYTGGLNLSQKIAFRQDDFLEVKAGAFYEDKQREFRARNLGFVRTLSTNPDLLTGSITDLFQPQNINNQSGIRVDEQTNPNDSYDASNRLAAGYLSVNVPLTKKLNIIAGARYENNVQALQSSLLNGQPVNVEYPVGKLLPSANLTYNFTEKSLVRLAYGTTVNRPEFRELAPFAFFDFDYNIVYAGNPSLKTATVNNLDLRYEFYPTPAEVISIAGFYKKFTNPIEALFDPGAGSQGIKNINFGNAQGAVSSGVEIEIRKSLNGLTASPILERMSVLFNTALIYSKVELGGNLGVGQSDNRPLQGQSPYIVNTGLNYHDHNRNFQLNLLYNVIGKRIFAVGFEGYPDIYEMPRNILDLTFSKGIGTRWTLKGGVTDLLNQSFIFLQDGNQDGKFDRRNDQIIQDFRPGSTVQLGISYRIL